MELFDKLIIAAKLDMGHYLANRADYAINERNPASGVVR
jgi:hypothetical protein